MDEAEADFGRYQLIELIGQGAMGKVYKARDTAIGRDVAIKVLPTDLANEKGYRERFRREAYTAARLTEPHIIPIYDTGEIDGHLYLSMPVIDGIDIASLLKRDGPLTPELAVKVIEQLALALDAAHSKGLVHRDVKPSNALMTGQGFVYLIDFGIAHDVDATRITKTNMVVGTFAYMAPERFTNATADARADIYALACVLHECLTGQTPYPGSSLEQMMAGHLTLDPPEPTKVNPVVPAGFDAVIARGMAKDPERRYQTASALAAGARQALADAPGATQVIADAPAAAEGWGNAESGDTGPIPDRPEDEAKLTQAQAHSAPDEVPTVLAPPPAARTLVAAPPAGATRPSAAGELATLLSPSIPFVLAALLTLAFIAVAFVGLGTPSHGGDLPPGTVTIAGADPTTSGDVTVDLSKPIPVVVTAPDADSVKLSLDILGAQVGSHEAALAPDSADRTAILQPPVNRYVLAGRMTAQITVLRDHSPLGTYRFTLRSTQPATNTVAAGVTVVLILLACSFIESNLRLSRRGRENPLAILVVPMFAAVLAVAAVAAAWILLGHPPTVATLACSAGLAAAAGIVAVVGSARLGRRYRDRRSGRTAR